MNPHQQAATPTRNWFRFRFFRHASFIQALGIALFLLPGVAGAQQASPAVPPGPGSAFASGDWLAGARGVMGTVVDATASSLRLRLQSGSVYTIHFGPNTHILQSKAQSGEQASPSMHPQPAGPHARPPMEPIAASAIHPGDAVAAVGEVEDAAKSVGAVLIVRLHPEQAQELKSMEARYGKTWLAGEITAIHGNAITLAGILDSHPQTLIVDAQTTIRSRHEQIALQDLKAGEFIRAAGTPSADGFLARRIRVLPMRHHPGPSAPQGKPADEHSSQSTATL